MSRIATDCPSALHLDALRREGQLRALHAILIASTFSVLYFGSSFRELGSIVAALGTPVGHFLVASVIFALMAGISGLALNILLRQRFRQIGLRRIRSQQVRDMVSMLGQVIGVKVLAMSSGGPRDGRMSAFTIGRHSVIRIGTGALPLAVRDPEGFRFRSAHEIVHLWAGDPKRDQVVLTTYLAAAVLVSAGLGSVLAHLLDSIRVYAVAGGLAAVAEVWWSTLWFALMANLISLGFLVLILLFERWSAMRLREFHADVAASRVVGLQPAVFADVSSAGRSDFEGVFRWLRAKHPQPGLRRRALSDIGTVYVADRILFLLQGYFGTLVLEVLLQLFFSNTSQFLVSAEVRRDYLTKAIEDNAGSYLAVLGGVSALLVISYGISIERVQMSVRSAHKHSLRSRLPLLASAPLLFVAGGLIAVASSQSTVWDLKQSGWDIMSYVVINHDRLLVHGFAVMGFFLAFGFALLGSGGPVKALWRPFALGAVPVVSATGAGLLLYFL